MLTNDGKTQLRLAPVGRPTKLASNVAAGLCCAQNIENLLGDLFCAVFSAWKWQSRDCEMEHGLSEKFDWKRFLLCCESSLSVRPDQGNLDVSVFGVWHCSFYTALVGYHAVTSMMHFGTFRCILMQKYPTTSALY